MGCIVLGLCCVTVALRMVVVSVLCLRLGAGWSRRRLVRLFWS